MNKKSHATTLLSFLAFVVLLNLLSVQNILIGVTATVLYILFFGLSIGRIIYKQQSTTFQCILGIITFLSTYILLGTLLFYVYALDQTIIISLFVAISATTIYLAHKEHITLYIGRPKLHISAKSAGFLVLYLATIGIAFYALFTARTTDALFSPWEVVPAYFWLLYVVATIVLLYLLKNNDSYLATITLSLHVFLSLGIVYLVYGLGYGFDPFIHHASENLLLETGTITPKPLYYIGQYTLVAFLSYFTTLSTATIDFALVPFSLAIIIPFVIYYTLKKSIISDSRHARLVVLGFLALPYTIFINSTPQAFANIFILLSIFVALLVIKKEISPYIVFLFALVATAIHPLSGIPALIFCTLLYLTVTKIPFRKVLKTVALILSSVALPLVLYLASRFSSLELSFGRRNLQFLDMLFPSFPYQYSFLLDYAYSYRFILIPLALAIIIVGGYEMLQSKKLQELRLFVSTAIVLLINALLMVYYISFSGVATEEQALFATRVMHIATFFLLPLLFVGIKVIAQKVKEREAVYTVFAIVLFTSFIVAGTYLRFPRLDDYDNSQFISISKADYRAVDYIESLTSQDYIVLANQMTSAAALDRFGFTRSYTKGSEEFYFYPIPTSGPLHVLYLELLENPGIDVITKARELTGIDRVYVALPHYWSRFEIIDASLQKEATAVAPLDNEITLYSF